MFTNCFKCTKLKECRSYHGGNEDTFDFDICKDCEVNWLFKNFNIKLVLN